MALTRKDTNKLEILTPFSVRSFALNCFVNLHQTITFSENVPIAWLMLGTHCCPTACLYIAFFLSCSFLTYSLEWLELLWVVLHAPLAEGIYEGVLLHPGRVSLVPRCLVSTTRIRPPKGPFFPRQAFTLPSVGRKPSSMVPDCDRHSSLSLQISMAHFSFTFPLGNMPRRLDHILKHFCTASPIF